MSDFDGPHNLWGGQVEVPGGEYHPMWCESNYTSTVAPYSPKPCNCGIEAKRVRDTHKDER